MVHIVIHSYLLWLSTLTQVERYIIHPSFDMLIEHDVALIQLSRPVLPSPHVSTICLPPLVQDLPTGTVCTVTGWGSLAHGVDEYPELLHQGEVPLVSERWVCESLMSILPGGAYSC